ncbi:DUF1254 domain-containing protein [Flammeovirga pectinis]|nr:DUF1254 domain-containing protein [Flammeovirga pectinis]
MNSKITPVLSFLLMGQFFVGCTPQSTPVTEDTSSTKIQKMKMSTEIPDGIESPNVIKSKTLGDLSFYDGVPLPNTVDKVYDYLDLINAIDAYTKGIQLASMEAMKQGILSFGPANQTALLFEDLMDSKALFLTANTTSVYMMSWLELGDEPIVIETPPDVLGIIDDHYFKYVADFGRLGPDKSKGGKFLILPPNYKGKVPKGYFVKQANTYGHWVIWRGFQKNGSPLPAIQDTKKTYKVYPLSQKDNPPAMNFVNVSGKEFNTIHKMDERIYDEIDAVIQAEPTFGENPEILGSLAAIGIEKGKKFAPDNRMKEILKEAAKVGSAIVRTEMAKPRSKYLFKFPNTQWLNPLAYKSYLFEHNGARLLDARSAFHFYATGITPAMSMKIVGKGSQYSIAYSDKDGNTFDGSKTYKFHVPANPPMKDFWSFTIYDNQSRSMLQTDQRFPGIDSNQKGLVQNKDGSWDIFIGPKAPKGFEKNWIQTNPSKGWNTIFRLYGPLEPWFENKWYPSDAVLVK